MKKLYFLLSLLIFSIIPAIAQPKGEPTPEQRKEFREFKMKYISQDMEMNAEAQKKFSEVYNRLSDERHALRKEMFAIHRKIKEKTATEQDYATLNRLRAREEEIESKYDEEFGKFLTEKQIFKMKEAENTFVKKLHDMSQKRKKDKKK
ncbi:MAG: hypothetical protein K2M45_08980 [Muribaculaceae bacterium]|nr:hypothetical protein [Muribaculaceae bacterium]